MKSPLRLPLLLAVSALLAGWGTALAQQNNPAPSADVRELSKPIVEVLDSLLVEYEHRMQGPTHIDVRQLNEYGFAPNERPRYSAEVIEERLQRLNFLVPMDYNPVVQGMIDMYTVRYPQATSKLLGLSKAYFPIIEEVFDRHGIPQELKYLCIVESAMNPKARSWAGAVGLWQFMYGTGKLYKLRIDSYIDERMDPVRSTEAAARYLKDLYMMYGDWHLALAAYNCGPGNLNRAIRRSGGKTTYWEIADYLPKETRGYVPAFIGATYAMNYATEHNIYPGSVDFDYRQDSIQVVRQKLNLRDLAQKTNTDYETLRILNPELKLGVVPYSERPYTLRVPRETALAVLDGEQNPGAMGPGGTPVLQASNQVMNSRLVYHTLQRGEQLSDVASQYKVRVKDLVKWNKLWGYKVKPGYRLKVYVPLNSSQYAATPTARTNNTQQASASRQTASSGPQHYSVRNGDTLWEIANRFGTTIDKLCQLNNISRNARLNIGQKLRVR